MRNQLIHIYPSDGSGCGMYRLIWPGKAVANEGKPVSVQVKQPEIAVDKQGNVRGINPNGPITSMILQRPGSYQISQLIPILHENDVKMIIDMDDSLSKIHPRNNAFKTYDPRYSHKRNWMHAQTACDMADLVTVTTEALAEEYGKHGRVKIIPNHVPESYLTIARPDNENPVVGWAGWTGTHIDDLRVTKGMINQAIVETDAGFVGFGDTEIFGQLGIRLRPPNEHWTFSNITEYPKKLVGFDIGLVPLQKNPFNECKSWLKGLEYASLGVVPVVTPIGDQLNLIDAGMALPASTPKEWYDTVKMLILDHEMRQELSEKVRSIAANWTIEGNSHKWWDAWSNA